jgi:photosynthetic reaction center cytochrome c subunit
MSRVDSLAGSARLALLAVAGVLLAGCERPPVETTQIGYRGTGMEQVTNPRLARARADAQQVPEALPAVEPEGPGASEVYENVQVLGHLTIPEFNRVMAAMTTWVSPEDGCLYCHAGVDLASDDVYTKVVSRRMIEMTQHINEQWRDHVGETGVTCFTCHRGKVVPEAIWFTAADLRRTRGLAASAQGQNIAAPQVGLTSLPADPFSSYLTRAEEIRVISQTALPQQGAPLVPIQAAEESYALMIHMSEGLGVNCVHCHNSRSFAAWDQSTPQRVTAWHGLRLVRDLNQNFLEPLTEQFPANRRGPQGDVAKINCTTCHQGVNLPLGGASMLRDYPELLAPKRAAAPAEGGMEAAPAEGVAPAAPDTAAVSGTAGAASG